MQNVGVDTHTICGLGKGRVINESHYIFNTTVSMVTKLGRMVTYHEALLILKVIKRFDQVVFQDQVAN